MNRAGGAGIVKRVVPDLLAARACLVPDRVALVDGKESCLTYGEWHQRSDQAARGLARKVSPGALVGLVYDNASILEFAVAYFAVLKAGGCAVPLAAGSPDTQLCKRVSEVSARLLLRSSRRPQDVGGAVPEFVLADLETGEFEPRMPRCRPDDLAQVLFTSGSTGTPIPVGATHGNLTGAFANRAVADLADLCDPPVFVHTLPVGTNAAQSMLLTCLTEPDLTVVPESFDPIEFCQLIERRAARGTLLVPAMAHALLADDRCRKLNLESLQVLGLTGAATPPDTLVRLGRLFPKAVVRNFYTSTEAWPVGVSSDFDPVQPDAVGRVDPEMIRIRREDGSDATPGETGEVLLAGGRPNGRSYLAEAGGLADIGNWVATGDLGFVEDGFLYLVDRKSRIINTGGYKVAPQEIENALHTHPGVAAAVAFDLPHEALGSMIAAAVVRADPGDGTVVDEAGLLRHLSGLLQSVQIPHSISFVPSLPLTSAGKVDWRRSQQLFLTLRSSDRRDDDPLEVSRREIEESICAVWGEELGRAVVTRDDNFFELGGYSVLAVQIVLELNARLGTELPLDVLYRHRTPAALAELLNSPDALRPSQQLDKHLARFT